MIRLENINFRKKSIKQINRYISSKLVLSLLNSRNDCDSKDKYLNIRNTTHRRFNLYLRLNNLESLSKDNEEVLKLNSKYENLQIKEHPNKDKEAEKFETIEIDWDKNVLEDLKISMKRFSEIYNLNSDNLNRLNIKKKNTPNIISNTDEYILDQLYIRQTSNNFLQFKSIKESLPIYSYKNNILLKIKSNNVTIISSTTGSGKSTQIPQYIYEDEIKSMRGSKFKIIVIEPRILAATTLASRVSQEQNSPLGSIVGYHVKMSKKASKETQILYMTAGIFIRIFSNNPTLQGISHIIVDEVHERTHDTDFSLALLNGIWKDRPDLKVILMSATMDNKKFSCYFSAKAPSVCELRINSTLYKIKEYYLREILQTIDIDFHGIKNSRDAYKDYILHPKSKYPLDLHTRFQITDSNSINRLSAAINSYEYHIGVSIILNIIRKIKSWTEILNFKMVIEKATILCTPDINIFTLHSKISCEIQNEAFIEYKNCVKIIISTNIAETSITIHFGRVKCVYYDKNTKASCSITKWISMSSERQRQGRAGRTSNGLCFKIYTKNERRYFNPAQTPEILTISMDNSCLLARIIHENNSLKEFFSGFLDPPTNESIDFGIKLLREMGAMTNDNRQSLTNLGKIMSMIPLDPILSKLLLYGCTFDILDPILTLVACLSEDCSHISADKNSLYQLQRIKQSYKQKALNDFVHIINVFKHWEKCNMDYRNDYCSKNLLDNRSMESVLNTKTQLIERLESLGLDCTLHTIQNYSDPDFLDIFNLVISIGFSQNICKISSSNNTYLLESSNNNFKFSKRGLLGVKANDYSHWIVYFKATNIPYMSNKAFINDGAIVNHTIYLLSTNNLIFTPHDQDINKTIIEDINFKGVKFIINNDGSTLIQGFSKFLDDMFILYLYSCISKDVLLFTQLPALTLGISRNLQKLIMTQKSKNIVSHK